MPEEKFDRFTAVRQLVDKAAEKYKVDPNLLMSIIHSESSFRRDATSKYGHFGLILFSPDIAKQHGVDDPYDPEQNVMAGAAEMSRLLKRFKGDPQKALKAYHMGVTGSLTKPPGPETRKYVAKTMKNYKAPGRLEGEYTPPPRGAAFWRRQMKEGQEESTETY